MPSYLVGPTRTYTTIQAAFNAIPNGAGNITGGTGVHTITIDRGVYPETISFSANGNASDYLVIQVASGAEHKMVRGAGVVIGVPGNICILGSAYQRISNLQFKSSLQALTDSQILENIAVFNEGNFGGISVGNSGTATSYLRKCIVVALGASPVNPGFTMSGGAGTLNILENCGTYRSDGGFYTNGGTSRFINCWEYRTNLASVYTSGYATAGSGANDTSNSKNNASRTSTVPGSNNLTSQTLTQYGFSDVSGNDFHLSPSSVLINAGYDLSAEFTTDIDLETIASGATWSIGPDISFRNSLVIGGTSCKALPWPRHPIRPAIEWMQDSAGYWNGSDRGYAQDVYESTVLFQGTESTINTLEQTLDSNREAVTLSGFEFPLFAPNVDHTGTLTAAVLEIHRRQVQFGLSGHVYELAVTFRAISPTLLSTTPSMASLKPQEGFQAEHTYESPKAFAYGQTAYYEDRRSDVGVLDVDLVQNLAQARAILAYVLGTARAGAVAFPAALSTIAYPWGRARGAATNCKIMLQEVSRMNLNRWRLKLRFVEAP